MAGLLHFKKHLDGMGLTFDRTQGKETSEKDSAAGTTWESRMIGLQKPFCSQDGFCKDHANFVGIDETGPMIVSAAWEDVDQPESWFEKKQLNAFVRTSKGFSFITLNRSEHEILQSKKKVPATNLLVLILEKYLTVMGLGSLNAVTLASNLHVATDLGLCHALRKIDLEHLMYGGNEFDVVFSGCEEKLRRLLSQEAPQKVEEIPKGKKANPEKKKQITMEFLETERKYNQLLEIIDEKYYRELQVNAVSANAFITLEEVKGIFFGIDRILDVNRRFLQDLEFVVKPTANNKIHPSGQGEMTSLEQVILKHVQAFEQYTPFVNNYDDSTRLLDSLQTRSSAFRSFLVSSRMLPGAGRSDLNDLLINPIQRIPRYVLLLTDILRITLPEDPLYEELKEATVKMSKMASYINETKDKTVRRLELFEITSKIEDCPPTLLSANRRYVSRLDVMEYDDQSGVARGKYRTLYLFNDRLLIAKRKSKLGSVKNFAHKFDSLEDLSSVAIEQYGMSSDGKTSLISLEIAQSPPSGTDKKDKKEAPLSKKFILGTNNLVELTAFIKSFMLTQSKNNGLDSKHKFVRCTANQHAIQYNLFKESEYPKSLTNRRKVVSLAFCSEDSPMDILSKAFSNSYVAILLVSMKKGGVRCIVKAKDNLTYFGPEVTSEFPDPSVGLADLILAKALEGQRTALDESPSLQKVHDKHCAELAKVIVTTQIVNDKITRLTSLKRLKSRTGTPLKPFGQTPSKLDAIQIEKPLVNRVVVQLIQTIELKGLALADSLYPPPLSPDTPVVQAVLMAVEGNKAEIPNETLTSLSLVELTSVLQYYLRSTCALLFPQTFEQRVEQVAEMENPKEMRTKIREAVLNLPHSGNFVLRLILEHIDRILKISQEGAVQDRLTEAFAPLLFSFREDAEEASQLLKVLLDLMQDIYEAPKPRLSISTSSTSLFEQSQDSPTRSNKRKSLMPGEIAVSTSTPSCITPTVCNSFSANKANNKENSGEDQSPKKLRMTPPEELGAAVDPKPAAAPAAATMDPKRAALEEELNRLRDSNAKDRETKLRIVALRRQLQGLVSAS